MAKVVIGVDLGGTNVRAGAFWYDGTPAGPSFENPSHAEEGAERVLDAMAGTIHQAVAAAAQPPVAVGLAIPGHADDARGLIRWAPNFGERVGGVLRGWRDVPIRDPLQYRISLPVRMGNDANLAALGEYRYGTGEDRARLLVMLTVGTGIGGGVVIGAPSLLGEAKGPQILIGANGAAAELGHIVVQRDGLDCNAHTYGSLEAYCQRDAIIRRAVHRMERARPTLLHELTEGDPSRVTPRLITQAADAGDELAIQVYREVGTVLGIGIASLINVFAPDVFPIGGQIAKAGKWLLEPAIAAARDATVPSSYEDCRIVAAQQIEDAGMMGAAALALM